MIHILKNTLIVCAGTLVLGLSPLKAQEGDRDPVAMVLNHDGTLYASLGTGKELLAMGADALSRLIASLDGLAPEQQGKVALAIGLWGSEAMEAVPKLIEVFPVTPLTETSINAQLFMTEENEPDTVKLEKFTEQYEASQSKITMTTQGVQLDDGSFKMSRFFVFEAPPAVIALYKITGEYAGREQADWREWWELRPPNS